MFSKVLPRLRWKNIDLNEYDHFNRFIDLMLHFSACLSNWTDMIPVVMEIVNNHYTFYSNTGPTGRIVAVRLQITWELFQPMGGCCISVLSSGISWDRCRSPLNIPNKFHNLPSSKGDVGIQVSKNNLSHLDNKGHHQSILREGNLLVVVVWWIYEFRTGPKNVK